MSSITRFHKFETNFPICSHSLSIYTTFKSVQRKQATCSSLFQCCLRGEQVTEINSNVYYILQVTSFWRNNKIRIFFMISTNVQTYQGLRKKPLYLFLSFSSLLHQGISPFLLSTKSEWRRNIFRKTPGFFSDQIRRVTWCLL